jgi:hypothetical protein
MAFTESHTISNAKPYVSATSATSHINANVRPHAPANTPNANVRPHPGAFCGTDVVSYLWSNASTNAIAFRWANRRAHARTERGTYVKSLDWTHVVADSGAFVRPDNDAYFGTDRPAFTVSFLFPNTESLWRSDAFADGFTHRGAVHRLHDDTIAATH